MKDINILNRQVALLLTRLLLGIIFFMQGFGKVFTWGITNLYERAFASYKDLFFSEPFLWTVAVYTSYAELIAGFLLIIGLLRNLALYALGSVLLIVSFGHGLASPIWPLDDVIFRFALIIFLLWMPNEEDKWRMDSLIWKNKD